MITDYRAGKVYKVWQWKLNGNTLLWSHSYTRMKPVGYIILEFEGFYWTHCTHRWIWGIGLIQRQLGPIKGNPVGPDKLAGLHISVSRRHFWDSGGVLQGNIRTQTHESSKNAFWVGIENEIFGTRIKKIPASNGNLFFNWTEKVFYKYIALMTGSVG